MSDDYNPSNWSLTGRLLAYIKPYGWNFAVINVTAFGQNLYGLVAPLLVMLIIDNVLVPTPNTPNWFIEVIKSWTGVNDRFGLLVILSIITMFSALVSRAASAVHRIYRGILSQRILRDLRRNFYEALIGKSLEFLNQVRTGQIISRVTSDMNSIDLFYSETVRESIRMTAQIGIALYVLFLVNTNLTLVFITPLPFVFLFTYLYSTRVRQLMFAMKTQYDSLTSLLIEGITAQKLIKGFGQEEPFATRFEGENQEYVKRSLRTLRIQSMYTPVNTLLTSVGVALVITFGGLYVVNGTLTIGELVLFGTYFAQLVGPVRMYARLIDWWQDALVSSRRVFEVIDVGQDVPEKENAIVLPRLRGKIEFRDVSFSYGSNQVLSGIDFEVKPGERVAIIGFVGSGKSALCELFPRFYDVTSGRVLVDGFDVRDVTLKSLRSQVGIVLQDVYIFSSTIRENITFGRLEATDDEVIAAAKAAQIHDYIVSLPKGYDTEVGERGLTLSGGQRQRVAIARVLLMNPSVLILDDSTSNVDAETEVLIRKAIESLLKERTALIITQRASTCETSDIVLVVEGGKVSSIGNHFELLKTSTDYRRLIESQTLSID